MNEQLLLKNIRNVLIRLEETIIFSLIERSQFKRNCIVYQRGGFGSAVGDDSLVGYMLHETERVHARLRRYTSPDEHPFYDDLPPPVLKQLNYRENPLQANTVNVNAGIRAHYESVMVPDLCSEGDDGQYGSAAVCDVACLQALSKRIHYGKFVAESKYQESPDTYDKLISCGDTEALLATITDAGVEARLLERVAAKAFSCSSMLLDEGLSRAFPDTAVTVYRDFIIPLTKQVELDYLYQR